MGSHGSIPPETVGAWSILCFLLIPGHEMDGFTLYAPTMMCDLPTGPELTVDRNQQRL